MSCSRESTFLTADLDPREAVAHRLPRRLARRARDRRRSRPTPRRPPPGRRRRASRAVHLEQLQQTGAVGARLGAEDARASRAARRPPRPARRRGARRPRARARRRSSARRARPAPATARPRRRAAPPGAGRRRGRSRRSAPSRRSADVRARPAGSPRGRSPAATRPASVGRTPSSARISAMSSPCVRIAEVPQATSPTIRGSLRRSRAGGARAARRRARADLPGQLGRQRARIDRVEVAPGRQHVDAPARGAPDGPAGTWRPFSAATRARSPRPCAGSEARPRRPRSAACAPPPRRGGRAPRAQTSAHGAAGSSHGRQRVQQRVCASSSRSTSSPAPRGGPREALDAAPLGASSAARPGCGHQLPARRGRRRRRPRAAARHARRAQPQHRRHEPAQLLARGRRTEHVQPVLDLDVLDLAQVAVDVLHQLAHLLGRAAPAVEPSARGRGPPAGWRARSPTRSVPPAPAASAGRAPPGARTRRAAPRARRARRSCRRASSAARGGRRSRRARGAWPARPRRGR